MRVANLAIYLFINFCIYVFVKIFIYSFFYLFIHLFIHSSFITFSFPIVFTDVFVYVAICVLFFFSLQKIWYAVEQRLRLRRGGSVFFQ